MLHISTLENKCHVTSRQLKLSTTPRDSLPDPSVLAWGMQTSLGEANTWNGKVRAEKGAANMSRGSGGGWGARPGVYMEVEKMFGVEGKL